MTGKGPEGADPGRLSRLLGYLERDPQNLQLISDAAAEAIRSGDRDQARELIDRGLVVAGEDPARQLTMGNLLLANGDAGRAEALFVALATRGGVHPVLTYNIAYAQFEQGRYGDAIAALSGLREAEVSQLPQYELLLAKALYFDQQLESALQHINRHLQRLPADREGLGFKAMIAFDAGQMTEAFATARQLLAQYPDDAFGNLTLGSMALEQKQPVIAKEHIRKVLAQQPRMGRAWSVLGFADLQQNQLEEGRDHFEAAVKHMPNHLGTWHGLGWSQLLLGNIAAAHQAIESAMALDRNFAENHGTLAVIQILEGRLDEAEASIKRGIRLDPKSPSSQYARSLLLAERNQPDASRKLIERILTEAGMKDAAGIASAAVGFRPGQRRVEQTSAAKTDGHPDTKKLH